MAKKVDKWKSKKWYTIQAPEMFERKDIKETPSDSEEKLIGRTLKTPLSDITGKRNQRHIELVLQIEEVEGDKAKTKLKGYEISRSYLRRNIRKGRSLVKTIKDVEVDDKKLHITAYSFLVRKAHTSQQSKIREIMNEKLEEEASKNNFDNLVQKMIFGRTSTDIFRECKSISPIKRVEISKCKISE